MTWETLEVDIAGPIATVALNRPAQRNAFNSRMCEELAAAMNRIATDGDVRAVLLRANGPAFCAGADLKERKTMTDDDMRARRLKAFAAYAAIEALPQPVIALVHGACMGSGCEIAAACDFIFASSAASFRYPEVGWGTVGATQRLPRIVGKRMAKELLYTGRTVSADEARSIGLVNRVLADEELQPAAEQTARAIAEAPSLAVRLAKRCLDRGSEASPEAALAIELLAIEENLVKSDWKASIAGFGANEKRD